MKANKRWIRRLSSICFVLAIGLSLFVLVDLFILRRNLPPGVCPVDGNRPLMYVAIVLALASFFLSFIESRSKKD